MRIAADQTASLQRDLDRMYDGWFIETCDEWLVPYIAELVGHTPGPAAEAQQRMQKFFSARAATANAIAQRRRKGTLWVLESLGHDRRTGLCEGDWVELLDDDIEFRWEAVPLLQGKQIDVHRRIVTLGGVAKPVDLSRHPVLRRWDHEADKKAEGAVIVRESKDDIGWIELERGVRIRFVPGGLYCRGDYWRIPARVATGDIEWPSDGDTPVAIDPHGIRHHRAALATVQKDPVKWKDTQCGCKIDPLCPLQ